MPQKTTQPVETQSNELVPVSEETQAIVEKNLPDESDEVKQKFGGLIDAIKHQREAEKFARGSIQNSGARSQEGTGF
jgi:hypothetical protein